MVAKKVIEDLYDYKEGKVFFKPTLAHGKNTFPATQAGALSYFVAGIAAGSLPLAAATVAGSLIGTATAWLLEFDPKDLDAGIYGFNSAQVGITTLFFFPPGTVSPVLLVFVLATWIVLALGRLDGLLFREPPPAA